MPQWAWMVVTLLMRTRTRPTTGMDNSNVDAFGGKLVNVDLCKSYWRLAYPNDEAGRRSCSDQESARRSFGLSRSHNKTCKATTVVWEITHNYKKSLQPNLFIQNAKNEPFDLLEFCQTLPRKQHNQLWNHLLSLTECCVATVLQREDTKEEDIEKGEDESEVVQVSTQLNAEQAKNVWEQNISWCIISYANPKWE